MRAQAFKTYTDRLHLFNKHVEHELSVKLHDTMKLARLTIIEANVLKAVRISVHDMDEAQAMINGQINFKSLQKAQIKTSDVHPVMWKACQDILKGKKIDI